MGFGPNAIRIPFPDKLLPDRKVQYRISIFRYSYVLRVHNYKLLGDSTMSILCVEISLSGIDIGDGTSGFVIISKLSDIGIYSPCDFLGVAWTLPKSPRRLSYSCRGRLIPAQVSASSSWLVFAS